MLIIPELETHQEWLKEDFKSKLKEKEAENRDTFAFNKLIEKLKAIRMNDECLRPSLRLKSLTEFQKSRRELQKSRLKELVQQIQKYNPSFTIAHLEPDKERLQNLKTLGLLGQ